MNSSTKISKSLLRFNFFQVFQQVPIDHDPALCV